MTQYTLSPKVVVKQGTNANDTLTGSSGDDQMYGFLGNDWLIGLAGNDYLQGDAGNDTLDGGVGNDSLWGLAGTDSLMGGDGNDYLDANDNSNGDLTNNTLNGGAGSDLLVGSGGKDYLDGGTGNDNLYGYLGADNLNGGDGDDYLDANDTKSTETVSNTLNGGAGNDKLFASSGNDSLNGGTGADYLDASAGNDSLDGGAGNDSLLGGAGNDSYYVDNLNDVIVDSSGADTVYVSVNGYNVPSSIEHIVYSAGVQALPYFIKSLDSGQHWGDIGAAQKLNYSFVSVANDPITPNIQGFMPYTDAQKVAVRAALAQYSSIAGLTFTEVSDSNAVQLRFFRDDLSANKNLNVSNPAGYTWYPKDGDVHIKNTYTDLTSGSYGFELLLHEIGHGLGFKHPFEAPALISTENNTVNTIMSYTQTSPTNATTLKLFDMATIHYLYGVNASYHAGNETYALTQRYIADGAGIDTLSAATQTSAVTINLTAGSWNFIGAKASSILAANQSFLGYGTQLETAIGGAGSDTLTGNSLANSLQGGAGNDSLNGGLGADTLNGGVGKDSLIVTETAPATDVLRINAAESLPSSFDTLTGFKLATASSSAGTDKLDLVSTTIRPNVAAFNGTDAGVIHSNKIVNGLMSFDDVDTFTAPLTISSATFTNVISYLQANISTLGHTVVFNALGNSYVFQDGAASDTLVQLTGVTASGLTNTGLLTGGVWLV